MIPTRMDRISRDFRNSATYDGDVLAYPHHRLYFRKTSRDQARNDANAGADHHQGLSAHHDLLLDNNKREQATDSG